LYKALAISFQCSFSIFPTNHQFQCGPGLINRAHLYIDESDWERDIANNIFRHISGTPADLFGQETQTVPVAAIFSRKTGNLFANSLRFLVKM